MRAPGHGLTRLRAEVRSGRTSAPRPIAPVLNLRSFNIPNVKASFVRLRVLANQCTGGPDLQGDRDNDPANVTDCVQGSIQGTRGRVSELQVFRR